jgi:hypothetical protein
MIYYKKDMFIIFCICNIYSKIYNYCVNINYTDIIKIKALCFHSFSSPYFLNSNNIYTLYIYSYCFIFFRNNSKLKN